jgi:glycosyltransferase involved in cell wall biosynthesis
MLESPEKNVVSVGFLGVLIPLKGIYELIEAMRILVIERGVAVECIIAGENARQLSGLKAWVMKWFGFAHDVRAEVETRIARYGLQSNVRLLGFVADVRQLYPKIDVLCFPSHLDAAGRPVFEAAFYGIPSVVAINDPPEDAVIDGFTGIAVERPAPVLIADALQILAENPTLRKEMGMRARAWAQNHFSIESNAQKLVSIYRMILEK